MAEITYRGSGDEIQEIKIVNQMIFIRNETPFSLGDGHSFETRYVIVKDTLIVCLNGLRQQEGEYNDYSVDEETKTLRFNMEIDEEDVVIVDYITII